ncbi:LysR family transcriptional regulator [Rhizobium sp. CFBP 8762]|uniref:LysR substrate-binding domain-containing protein n=1 Tax=Rhizobium sp. CFBP 8762 TaxID=2775279 RepID=UPI0017848E87|nr:LysR substrate-binding domain-containing protein [Rhizobium sp. CFBP 8762]MBD8555198.1 LysR family transcriptional regulator [Rhizobium sp. CFBP 8762]
MTQPAQLDGIITFVQAAKFLSFTAAADQLGITKSAVGKSVARLEERLGTKLLHRSTRKLTLTPDGEAYLASCRHALEEISSAETALLAKNQQIAGRLRIDAPAAWGRQILLPVLARIARQNPGLSLSLSLTDRIIDPVEENVDLAIRFGETKDTSGLITRKLAEQRALIVASPDYISQRGAPDTVEDIQKHECIVGFRRDIPTTWRIKAGDGSIFRVTPPASHEIGDGAAIVDAAVAGLGLAQMPSSLLVEHIKSGRLTPVLQQFTGAKIDISAVWPATRHLLPRVRHVVEALAEEGRRGHLGT